MKSALGQAKQVFQSTMMMHDSLLLLTDPGPVSMLTYGRLTSATIAVSWEAPQEPRGVITKYILTLLGSAVIMRIETNQSLIKVENLSECGHDS